MTKDRKFWFSRSEVAGVLAMWAIRQSPHAVPDRLADAVLATRAALPVTPDDFFPITEAELRDTLTALTLSDPSILAWNLPKSGHDATTIFTSRYDKPAPDDDFIDLDALVQNICHTLTADQARSDTDYVRASAVRPVEGADKLENVATPHRVVSERQSDTMPARLARLEIKMDRLLAATEGAVVTIGVVHADREAAANFFSSWPNVSVPNYLPMALSEAFAAHRHEALGQAAELAEGLFAGKSEADRRCGHDIAAAIRKLKGSGA